MRCLERRPAVSLFGLGLGRSGRRHTPQGVLSRRAWRDFAAGLRVAFVLALLEAVALAVHFQDVHVVRELVQQRTGQPLRA